MGETSENMGRVRDCKKIKTNTTPKIADRGIQCIFVGYSKDHDGDCYEMWYPKTNRVYTTRDVIWLNRMYYTKEVAEGTRVVEPLEVLAGNDDTFIDPDDDDAIHTIPKENEDGNDEHTKKDETEEVAEEHTENQLPFGTTRSGTMFRDMAAANIFKYPVQLTRAEEEYMTYMKELNEIACIGAGIGGGFDNTMELHVMKYDTAMKSSDAEQWRKAVEEEYERMEENGVWTPVPKSTVPTNAKVLTSTWAMKKKSNGTFQLD